MTVETAIEVTEPALSVDSENWVETLPAAPAMAEKAVETAEVIIEPALSVISVKAVETAEEALATSEVTDPTADVGASVATTVVVGLTVADCRSFWSDSATMIQIWQYSRSSW